MVRSFARWIPVGLVVSMPLWLSAQTPAQRVDAVIQAGRLIDGLGTTVRERVTIVISGDRLTAVQAGWQAGPSGVRFVDLKASPVRRGLIDCQTHITGEGNGKAIVNTATKTPLDDAVRSTVYAKRTLEAGFTTIRNVGAEGGADIALKSAINE